MQMCTDVSKFTSRKMYIRLVTCSGKGDHSSRDSQLPFYNIYPVSSELEQGSFRS